ncbi:MAG: hypothetical protein R2838_12000 [Caldilineaceae bacterium]
MTAPPKKSSSLQRGGHLLQPPAFRDGHAHTGGTRVLQCGHHLPHGHGGAEHEGARVEPLGDAVGAHVGLEERGVGDEARLFQLLADGAGGRTGRDDEAGRAGVHAGGLVELIFVGAQVGVRPHAAAAGQDESQQKRREQAPRRV